MTVHKNSQVKPPAPVADMLCFDLYAASRAVTARYRDLLADAGLTYPQYLVLVLLHPVESLSVGQISGELQLDHSTLTPLLRRLEQAGVVTRVRRATDERVVDVALTTLGRRTAAELGEVQAAMTAAMGLSADEVRSLRGSLRRLTTTVVG